MRVFNVDVHVAFILYGRWRPCMPLSEQCIQERRTLLAHRVPIVACLSNPRSRVMGRYRLRPTPMKTMGRRGKHLLAIVQPHAVDPPWQPCQPKLHRSFFSIGRGATSKTFRDLRRFPSPLSAHTRTHQSCLLSKRPKCSSLVNNCCAKVYTL